jgi:signal peptidase I
MTLKWFISRTARRALALHKHVWKLLSHQRDILAPKAVGEVEAAMRELKTAVASNVDKAALQKQMDSLEAVANKWLKPYPQAFYRENVEMLLVALAVAMGIRTFFLQPFKIPTGSMQPTLYGVTSDNLKNQPDVQIPTGLSRIKEFVHGVSYVHEIADEDGTFDRADRPFRILIFNIKQTYWFAGRAHTIWFPPDYGSETSGLEYRAGIRSGDFFKKGDDIVKLKVRSGDYLFVDRLTYNFRPPKRGEIVVFETKGIPEEQRDRWRIPADQFYIKRLVGLSGERVQIGDDRHLLIDGHRLDAATPHFENVYSFVPSQPAMDSHYSGHVNFPQLTPFFQGKRDSVLIPTNNYMVMGDNTMSSLDSRFWGPFPSSSVIGRYCFVYWPLSSRFGWGNR